MRIIIFLCAALLTTSCTMWPALIPPITIKNDLPVGSTVRLNQQLLIPKDRSYIYIQNGKVAPVRNLNTVDLYTPYCMFYLKHEVQQQHTVKPDAFKITKIVEWEGYMSLQQLLKFKRHYARQAGFMKTGTRLMSTDMDDAPNITMYATIISLHSDTQQEVRRMVCGHWDVQSQGEHMTLQELKMALGNLMTIKVKTN